MNELTDWKVPKWPFFLANALLFGFAYFFMLRAPRAIHYWELAAGCVALGAVLSLIPYYLDFRVMEKALNINALGTVADRIENLEKISKQIDAATNHWAVIQGSVQAEAGKTTAAAKAIADKMAEEGRQFSEFMLKMNDREKAALRLELDKMHRAEAEWLQVMVRVLDHVFALHTGAIRTGDQRFIEPIANFQNACRGTVRRLGLTAFTAEKDEAFDAERHQPAGKQEKIPDNAIIAETIGAGYTYQGKLLRQAVVRLKEPGAEPAPVDELPLEVKQAD